MTDPKKAAGGLSACPVPIADYPEVLLAHGGGGRLMHQLIEKMFVSNFDNSFLQQRHDSTRLELGDCRLAFTTDSFVVRPLFFPGGNIGSLAIHGTVNDLAMSGARPLFLSAGFILEEGLPMETLWKIVSSMAAAAQEAGVQIVTGDTKVVDRGKGDGVYINTSGIGLIDASVNIGPAQVRDGDAVIVSGDLGRHGIAIMNARESLGLETSLESDSACVSQLTLRLLEEGIDVHCFRDLTRGGLASSLIEIAETSGRHIEIDEERVPVLDQVRGACEILGLDPFYIANEGRFVTFLPESEAARAVEILRESPLGADATVIGRVADSRDNLVTVRSVIGVRRILDMISGEQLPRIC
ncbi:MAG: hydrogenase expression/formation protein HypE [Acidobacteriota bacterium]|nr:MAG: hydrogenase expression/formation protein HypE [Acidobacteriota bacterium]